MLARRLSSLSKSDFGLLTLSFVVLLVCLFYAYLNLTSLNVGFVLDPRTWEVIHVTVPSCGGQSDCPKHGEKVLAIGELEREEFLRDRTIPQLRDFERAAPGQKVPVILERNGEQLTLYLRPHEELPRGKVKYLAWFFPLLFWFTGTAAVIFLRPRDERWSTLVLLQYTTAIWGSSGFMSGLQVGYAMVVYRIFIWTFPALLIHVHLVLPDERFPKLKKILLWPCYVLMGVLIVTDYLVHVPNQVLAGVLLGAIAVVIGLLLARLVVEGSLADKVGDRILVFGVSLGLLPICFVALVIYLTPASKDTFYGNLAGILYLVILPLWPLSYLYAFYKHGAGKTEMRANRILGVYGFFACYIATYVIVYILASPWFADKPLAFSLALSFAFVVAAPPLQRRFRLAVDRLIYGIEYQPEQVLSLFAERIPSAFNRAILRDVILEEILPTLMIRQSSLYLFVEDGVERIYRQEVPETDKPMDTKTLRDLESRVKPYANLDLEGDPVFSWVHLLIPLASKDHPIGVWLLGRRDPDDYYPRSDIELITHLANQIAPVIENVRLVERARQEVAENRRLQGQLIQSQKMEAIGRLSAGVAHDFNNLLSVILGYSSLLLSKYRDDEILGKYLNDIKDAGNRAASLTKQLLAFSRQQVMEARVMDLNTVVEDVEKMLRRLTGEDVELQTRLADDLPPVKIDPSQMGQVIMNLAVNSRDAMPEGGRLEIVTCRVELARPLEDPQQGEVPPGIYACMRVRDTGTGVTSEVMGRMFEPYYTTKDLGKGTGLGLSMVYGIINQSRGHIRVESQVGLGTLFSIYLPAADRLPEDDVAEDSTRTASGSGSETILVVEDEESVRTVACEILEAKGYQVLEASNGAQALEDCARHAGPIDLLLTDVIMPHMKGTELARRLLEVRPGIKVMYMSGYNEESILGRRLGESGSILVQKPFSPQGLARRVREVLDSRAAVET